MRDLIKFSFYGICSFESLRALIGHTCMLYRYQQNICKVAKLFKAAYSVTMNIFRKKNSF